MTDQLTRDAALDSDRRETLKKVLHGFLWCFDHWVLVASLLLGAMILVPFLAPVFMRLGWTGLADLIYTLYSPLCHQMAQRSFFLFGPQPMYDLSELPVSITPDKLGTMVALRAFIGNADLGWKIAWSDRMVYMFGGLWLAGALFGLLRHRRHIHPIGLGTFALLLLPMLLDGGTHLLSDSIGGLTGGFRYDNRWLADLTGNALPSRFYVGDAFGSFNSWMRLISGLTFGFGTAWLAYPYLNTSMVETAEELRAKLRRADTVKHQFVTGDRP